MASLPQWRWHAAAAVLFGALLLDRAARTRRAPADVKHEAQIREVEARIRADANTEETFSFTEEHLAALRGVVIGWDDSESGAPHVMRWPATTVLGEDLGRALQIVLKFGVLDRGPYGLEDPQGTGDAGARIFDFTADHLRLIHGAHASGTGIDSKRPYGDMRCFYFDMARLLDVAPEGHDEGCQGRFSKPQIERFDALHSSMGQAVQVFLAHAVLPPAIFARRPAGYGTWRQVAAWGAPRSK
jgi:hypothetical protein